MNRYMRVTLSAVMEMMDIILGDQNCLKMDKIKTLREIEQTAKRMADGIERRLKEVE